MVSVSSVGFSGRSRTVNLPASFVIGNVWTMGDNGLYWLVAIAFCLGLLFPPRKRR
jgi:hypothetical protein